MNEAQTQLAEKIGQLLAQSPLDDKIKSALLEKMDEIPEPLLFKLLDALEMENDDLERTAFEIDLYLREQDEAWKEVTEEQKKIASEAVQKIADTLS